MTKRKTFEELSCYLLPGHTRTPAHAIEEARAAEAASLGRVWLSERFELRLTPGVGVRNQMMGLEPATKRMLFDGLDILRKLWKGEKVMGYDNPLGKLP
jgi:5,10-methylenetetrahydromethanopterin reductase